MTLRYVLRKKDKGQEVAKMQSKVGAKPDGDFGPKTEQSVRDYQENNSLIVDGIAGPQTLGHMGVNVLPAVDVSSHQGTIDFKKMATTGVSLAWIKLSEGQTHKNPGYKKKFDDARAAGFTCGGYHFGRSDNPEDPNDWEREAENFLEELNKAGFSSGDLVPVLDVEKGAKIDDNHNVEWCLKWLDLVGRETNSTPMIYTAKWAYDLYLMKADKSELAKLHQYPIWWARYIRSKRLVGPEQKLKGWSTWDVWQYTGHGTLAGAKGRIDLNWVASGHLDKLRIK